MRPLIAHLADPAAVRVTQNLFENVVPLNPKRREQAGYVPLRFSGLPKNSTRVAVNVFRVSVNHSCW
jgi:hypothetical protein